MEKKACSEASRTTANDDDVDVLNVVELYSG